MVPNPPANFSRLVREEVDRLLRDPVFLPGRMKSWVPNYVQAQGVQIPAGNVVGLHRSSETVAELGAGRDGAVGLIRVGGSPYEFVSLSYSATSGKWISARECVLRMDQPFSTTSASYTTVQENAQNVISFYPHYKLLYDAGLRGELYLTGRLVNTGANDTTMSFLVAEFADGATSSATLLASSDSYSISSNGTGDTYKAGGWFSPTITPTVAHVRFVPQIKVSAGTGTLSHGAIWFRWVSA